MYIYDYWQQQIYVQVISGCIRLNIQLLNEIF